jgi:dephospho-CoA kinase
LRIADCGLRIELPGRTQSAIRNRKSAMLNVALTGNIAAGKSTVVELFRGWGATIIDADELVRQAQAPGGEVLAAIAQRFGSDVLAADGSLDRAALRSKVMGDQAALDALNAIVHPAVRRRRDELAREARERGDVLVVNDIPLLFEVLDPGQFDVVVLVDAGVALRRTRLRAMRGLSNEEADRMIAAQMPAERKRPRSDFVIDNDGSVPQLERAARDVFEALRRRAARAALGRPAQALLVAAADGEGKGAASPPSALNAIVSRYSDAGLAVRRVTGASAVEKALAPTAPPPDAIVATVGAAATVERAWERAGRPGILVLLSDDPDPVAVRLDLRPWGAERLRLIEPGAHGAAPRPDLFPSANPLG